MYMEILTSRPSGFASNSYVLLDRESGQAAVVDPSISWQTAFRRYGSDLPQLKYILLTHGHFDHMLSLAEWKDKFGAPVCIHKNDAECLGDPKKSYFLRFSGRDTTFDPPDITFSDGDIITLGEQKIKIMHTPGHTRGSVCYVAGSSIFSGDTILRGDIGRCDLYGGNINDMMTSVKRIA